MSSASLAKFDIAIVGAGLVGATLAVALGRAGFRTALIDRAEPAELPVGSTDERTVALSVASERLLKKLDLWPAVAARGLGSYEKMQVWDAAGYGSVTFAAAELGLPALGHIVENLSVQRAAWQAVRLLPNTELICPAVVEKFSVNANDATLQLEGGIALSAHLVISAEGGNSLLRDQLEIGVYRRDYEQRGIVANVKTEKGHQNTAWQRFLPTGPLAFLPLASGQSSIVWSLDNAAADKMMSLDDEAFSSQLTEALDGKLGRCELASRRLQFPLKALLAEQYVAERFALVGDSAHAVHPLAGQGANLGLLDVASLVDVLVTARQQQRDIGALPVLRRYQRWRKGENATMLLALDGLKHLFGAPQPAWSRLRSVGMNMVDIVQPMRIRFARHAAGIGGDVPPLSR